MIPPKRLKYEKWNGCDNVIVIDLHNGYSVIAIWSTENGTNFTVTLHLKENTIDMWDLIINDWQFSASIVTINAAILRTVADNLLDNFFESFIDRYKYYLRCSQLGCDLLDKERLGDK